MKKNKTLMIVIVVVAVVAIAAGVFFFSRKKEDENPKAIKVPIPEPTGTGSIGQPTHEELLKTIDLKKINTRGTKHSALTYVKWVIGEKAEAEVWKDYKEWQQRYAMYDNTYIDYILNIANWFAEQEAKKL